jgi:hypothetical protein
LSGNAYGYNFLPVEVCNMCGADVQDAKVLGRRLNRSQGLRPKKRAGIATTVVRCRACGLVFANPQPVPVDFGQHYGVAPEEYWKDEYFDEDPTYFDHQIDSFFRLWQQTDTRQPVALDVGAGLGKAMKSLTRRGLDAYGLEPSKAFADAAVERAKLPAERLTCASVEEAEYPAGKFDFVTFGAVLEHLYEPAAAIERTSKWCAPGGLIHLEVPSSRWLVNRLVNLAYRVQGLDYCANISPMHVPYHLYEFTLESFNRHGARAGYDVVDVTRYVGPTYLPRYVSGITERLMTATGTGMQLEVWLRAHG